MPGQKPLTATEAADRIAKRHRQQKRSQAEDADQDTDAPLYTCESCGCHDFDFVRTTTMCKTERHELECTCGHTDLAACREFSIERETEEVAPLDEEHRPDFSDSETTDGDERSEEDEHEVNCQQCVEHAADQDWAVQAEDWQEDPDSLHCEVRCAECGHEIEFGYSHEDRGGRIWPVESSDFNPYKTWPEERFKGDWQRRGWLRPPG